MTNARKIEVLDCARVLIDLEIEKYICLSILECLNNDEFNEYKLAVNIFGDLLTKHKPLGTIYGWFPSRLYSEKQAKESRLEIIDKMIAELKTLEQ